MTHEQLRNYREAISYISEGSDNEFNEDYKKAYQSSILATEILLQLVEDLDSELKLTKELLKQEVW